MAYENTLATLYVRLSVSVQSQSTHLLFISHNMSQKVLQNTVAVETTEWRSYNYRTVISSNNWYYFNELLINKLTNN